MKILRVYVRVVGRSVQFVCVTRVCVCAPVYAGIYIKLNESTLLISNDRTVCMVHAEISSRIKLQVLRQGLIEQKDLTTAGSNC